MKTGVLPSARRQELLLINDDDKIGKGIQRLFRQYQVPWRYNIATGIADALARLHTRPIDALLADIRASGSDGVVLLKLLRAHDSWRDLPVVMLIDQEDTALGSATLDLGATDLLYKPVTPEELLARIRVVLHLKSCQDLIKRQQSQLEVLNRQRHMPDKGSSAPVGSEMH